MLRTALLLFGATVALLVFLALLPEDRRSLPDQQIQLSNATVFLYPQADPQAVWRFVAPQASYDPESGRSTLLEIEDGRREVDGELDFTVASERLTIDRNDAILGELIFAFLVSTGECLTMSGSPDTPVVIDQEAGRFEVPVLEVGGPSWGEGSRYERMSVSFDLEEFGGGGPGTSTTAVFRVGEAEEEIRSTVCENS